MSTQQQFQHHHQYHHYQNTQKQHQQIMNNLSTRQLMTHIEQISIMLVTAVAILSVLFYLLFKKNKYHGEKQTINGKERRMNNSGLKKQQAQFQQQRQRDYQKQKHTKRYSFSVDDQYPQYNNNTQMNNKNHINYPPQHYQPPTYNYQSQHQRLYHQNQLVDLLHQHQFNNYNYHQPYPSQQSQQYYSLKQQKENFLNSLKLDKLTQTGVYLDQQDLLERKMRKVEIQKRKNLLLQQEQQKLIQISNKNAATKEKEKEKEKEGTKRENQKKKLQQQQQLLSEPKVQEKKFTQPLGEKTLFADKTQQKPATLPPQGGINFNQITLNLPSEKALPKETEQTKGLFGDVKPTTNNVTNNNVQPLGTTKKQQKPSLFPSMNSGGIGTLFGQQTSGEQKQSLFVTGNAGQQQPQSSLFGNKETITTQKPLIEKKQQTAVPPKPQQPPTTGISQPVLPQPQPPKPSNLTQQSLSSAQKIQKKDYLQMLINYSNSSKQHCELKKTKTNNFGRSISNLKQIYDTSIDFINTINIGDSKQVQTLACVIYDFLINKTIPTWPKQQGWEMFPPRSKNQTQWKISITTYVLKLNLYRAMGHENLWLIVFGKLLSLLDFAWKRNQQIPKSSTAYKELDMVKNGYFSLQKQDDMAPKYFTRLDLVTYFLFCMTTFDPQLVAEYLCQTAGQDKQTYEEIKKLKYKWTYNYFWILVETIITNKTKTYFKPILHMNILSSMYLQIRKNKLNSNDFKDFDHLRKYIIKEAIEYTSDNELERNDEIQTLAELDEQNRDFRFDGEDFLGQIETLNFYFKEKDGEYRKASADRKGFEEFEKRCSVFDFFKSQSKLG